MLYTPKTCGMTSAFKKRQLIDLSIVEEISGHLFAGRFAKAKRIAEKEGLNDVFAEFWSADKD